MILGDAVGQPWGEAGTWRCAGAEDGLMELGLCCSLLSPLLDIAVASSMCCGLLSHLQWNPTAPGAGCAQDKDTRHHRPDSRSKPIPEPQQELSGGLAGTSRLALTVSAPWLDVASSPSPQVSGFNLCS